MSASAEILIIGAGPAGLAMAACLKERGLGHRIVERGEGVGQSWRDHYRRLHLHTAKELSSLPGMDFGVSVPRFPSRAQVVSYLEDYVAHHGLEVELGVNVERLAREGDEWVAQCSNGERRASAVVLATGLNRVPKRPVFQGQKSFGGEILHAVDYRDPSPFAGKRVLVVGAGNTGGEIALDLAEKGCPVSLCVRSPLHVIPRSFLGRPTQVTGVALSRLPLRVRDWISLRVSKTVYRDLEKLGIRRPRLGVYSQIERERKIPLIDIGTIDRIRRGDIRLRPAVARFDEQGVHYRDGSYDELDAVVLATGYTSGLETWIEGGEGIIDEQGYPVPTYGETALPGLYTLGYANVAGGLLRQIAIDAPRLADLLARRGTRA